MVFTAKTVGNWIEPKMERQYWSGNGASDEERESRERRWTVNRAWPKTTTRAWVCLICGSEGRGGREASIDDVEG